MIMNIRKRKLATRGGFSCANFLFFHSPDCNGAALRVHRFHPTLWHLGYLVMNYLGYRAMKHLGYYQEFSTSMITITIHCVSCLWFGFALPHQLEDGRLLPQLEVG